MKFATLFRSDLSSWVSTRGFVTAALAALVPVLLAGAWLATHQADLEATEVAWDGPVVEGQELVFEGTISNPGGSAVGRFNASLSVGTVFGNTLNARATNDTEIDGLGAGESRTLQLAWTPSPGAYWVLLDVDPASEDLVGEIDEFNNQVAKPFVVNYAEPPASQAPTPPGNLSGDGAPTPVTVNSIAVDGDLAPGKTLTFTATVSGSGTHNVTIEVGRTFNGILTPMADHTETVILDGGTNTVTMTWSASQGAYWMRAYANATGADDTSDNHVARTLVIQPVAPSDDNAPERDATLTIKQFYINVLANLQFIVIVPLIVMAFTVGVITDARREGDLVYLLTRPVPRWMVPVSRFLAGGLVALIAVLLGTLLAYVVLFQTPEADLGFLTTPLLASVLAVLAYGAFFVLLGVLVEKAYWWGLAFVFGWETLSGFLLPWTRNFTIGNQLADALREWPFDQGLVWLPEGESVAAVRNLLIMTVVFLGAAAVVMKRREFSL